ncbi:MAG: P-loop NTPase [Candidatus Aenigmarchaeota archaeon]|nr:P-loop NTPase [Candidatus Aenigmarchaeota archaeon]
MTRIITLCSGKGGAGKTFLTANLGAALAEYRRDVVVVDANLTTPNLGFHLGVPLYPTTLHDVLKGKAKISDALYEHSPGLKIVPAGIALRDLQGTDARDFPNALLDLLGNTDIVLIDSAAGLGREALASLETADELVLVTNPELPAVADALKAAKLAEQLGTRVSGVVLNRVAGKKHEMKQHEVLTMLDHMNLLAEIPEDSAVQQAIARRMPVIHHAPRSKASMAIRRLAGRMLGYQQRLKEPWYARMFSFLR